jgi:CrcB protein
MPAQLKKKTSDKLISQDSHPELPLDSDAIQPGVSKSPLHLRSSLQLIVFLGGCFGTLARYSIENFLPASTFTMPYGTLLINLLGAFLLGTLLECLVEQGTDSGNRQLIRLGVGTGFIGAFTTYSTLAVEVVLLGKHNHAGIASLYAVLSIGGGLICSAAGIHLTERYHSLGNRA